ncbi:dual specificity protein phosphatase family protein [Leptolyngbya sp. FACHB-261]|uniref:protein-tyrosine phosphatase family protein n=1 Tax=Leptolyngbya sp. FACHB-261 TaxID=2692806 RepID=UPI00168749E1|nr:dual specificity protein phosphatase [Leptolyngbya sp. FACHB-261]MBD2105064.1 dual specificity protein phosphatase family protein [Leptolyngbya sp. FACHB-261]
MADQPYNWREPAWVIPNYLALGPFPQAQDLERLRVQGITAVLTLNEIHEGSLPIRLKSQFTWTRVPIPDGLLGGVPKVTQLSQCMEVLGQWRTEGHHTYVHCMAGVGRSPLVCAAYLIVFESYSLSEAMQQIQYARPIASPDARQLMVLSQFLQTRLKS